MTRRMPAVNAHKWLYFALVGLRGQRLGAYYERYLREERTGIPCDTTKRLLVQLLAHCRQRVSYYARVIRDPGDSFYGEPEEYLRRFPVLTKSTIRSHFEELESEDLSRRSWYFKATSGSTGEPVRHIQDREYAARAGAVTLLYSKLVGREIGEHQVHLWGPGQDIALGHDRWRARLIHRLTNTAFLNAYRMTPERMRQFMDIPNTRRPRLIVAYPEALHELARYGERERLRVIPQAAVVTSAST